MPIVAPLVGAWIEMFHSRINHPGYRSLPLWERGLKSFYYPFSIGLPNVAPLVGAWIEIALLGCHHGLVRSLPLWERGLKYMTFAAQ